MPRDADQTRTPTDAAVGSVDDVPWPQVDVSDPAVVADALGSAPLALASLADRSRVEPGAAHSVDRADLALGLGALVGGLEADSVNLLQLAVVRGGITRPAALGAAPHPDPDHLDRCARRVVALGLASFAEDRLVAAPAVRRAMPVPAPMLRREVDLITSARLDQACRRLGIDGGTRKADRAEALLTVLEDPEALAAAVEQLSGPARRLFRSIVGAAAQLPAGRATPPGAPPGAVSLLALLDDTNLRYTRRHLVYGSGERNAIDELVDSLLIGEDLYEDLVWPWLEVLVALDLAPSPAWLGPPTTSEGPIDDDPSRPAVVVAALHQLLDAVAASPLEGRKTGDRRPLVRPIRTAATAGGLDPDLAERLIDLAIHLGVVSPSLGTPSGRGRNRVHPVHWTVEPARRADLEGRTVAEQWHLLAVTWLSDQGDSPEGALAQQVRVLACAALASLPDGQGAEGDDLQRWLGQRHIALDQVEGLDVELAAAAQLGVASLGAHSGLTAAGRALLSGGDAPRRLGAVIGEPAATFLVQPDHSVIAPSDLAPAVRSTLATIADVVSEGGATVWHLSPQRLTELGATRDADEIVAFLTDHSSGPVPDNVARLVRDTVASTGRLELVDATTVVRCDDPATLADAARHRSAKLTVIAPTVATSPLATAKLADVLRRKGVAVTADGTVTVGAPTSGADPDARDEPPQWVVPHRDPSLPLPEPTSPALEPDSIAAVAELLTR